MHNLNYLGKVIRHKAKRGSPVAPLWNSGCLGILVTKLGKKRPEGRVTRLQPN